MGCVGNVLNIIVLNSQGMRTRTNCFLSAMALADIGFLISVVAPTIADYSNTDLYTPWQQLILWYLITTAVCFANAFSASTAW